jgi:5-methylcytosine-specific restriction protein A
MNEAKEIKLYLQREFHADFEVNKKNSANEEYIIKISHSANRYFYLVVTNKNDIRLSIACEPEEYAAYFMESIDGASAEKRELFCQYWEQLGAKNINVKINDNTITPDKIRDKNEKWTRFALRYTKAPFCDESLENKLEVMCQCIKLIIMMVLSLTDYFVQGAGHEEGAAKKVELTRYERNPVNRELCLLAKGYTCSVCGFNFEQVYGGIGHNFIEVHHSIPVSSMEEGHIVDPIKELYPVCSNCHSMLHKKTPPYTIEELRNIVGGANE